MIKTKILKKSLLLTLFCCTLFAAIALVALPKQAHAFDDPSGRPPDYEWNGWELKVSSPSIFPDDLQEWKICYAVDHSGIQKKDVNTITIKGYNDILPDTIRNFSNLKYVNIAEPKSTEIRVYKDAIHDNDQLYQLNTGGIGWMSDEPCIHDNRELEFIHIDYHNWDGYAPQNTSVEKLNKVLVQNGLAIDFLHTYLTLKDDGAEREHLTYLDDYSEKTQCHWEKEN